MKKLFSVAALLLCACSSDYSYADMLKPSSIISIYDGDTFTVNIDIDSCPPVLCNRISVRLRGIDAPEIRGKCPLEIKKAKIAKWFLTDRLLSAQSIELHNVARDKYFRLNADLIVDGINVSKEMIEKELVRSYDGGTRSGWCNIQPENLAITP